MRPVRKITPEKENYRLVPCASINAVTPKRNSVEPEPVGTIILVAFRITGYDPDCDGSLMARLEQIDMNGETTSWTENHMGLNPETDLVVTQEELKEMFEHREEDLDEDLDEDDLIDDMNIPEDHSFEPCEFCPAFHPDSEQDFHDNDCPNRK